MSERADAANRCMGRRPLALFGMLYGLGALIGFYSAVPYSWLIALAGAGALALALFRRKPLVFVMALLCGAAVTGCCAQAPLENLPVQAEDALITGRVAVAPVSDELKSVLTLDRVLIDGQPHGRPLRVYVYGDPVSAHPGDGVEMTGDTFLPRGQRNPGGFDFRRWLLTRGGVLCASGNASEFTAIPGAPSPMRLISGIREGILSQIQRAFPENAPLAAALLLGDRAGLSEEVTEDFRASGLSHLLAVSGLHVSCLALVISLLLHAVGLSKRAALGITLSLLTFYSALIGFPASVVRALLMFGMVSIAPLFGRPNDVLSALCAALLVLLMVHPLSIGDAGFQLSFSAVFSMLLLDEPVARLLHLPRGFRWPGFVGGWWLVARWLLCAAAGTLSMSIAIFLGMLPVMVLCFGSATPLSPLVNLIAIPLSTLAMPLCALKLGACALIPSLSVDWFPLPDQMLALLRALAERAAHIPYGSVPLPGWPAWLTATYCAACAVASPYARFGIRLRKAFLCALPLLVLCSILIAKLALPGGLHLTFLDVGQADAALVRAEGHAYLVDLGKPGSTVPDYMAYTAQSPKAVFLTHPHMDHAGALLDLVKRMPVPVVYVPECWDRVEVEGDIGAQLDQAVALGARVVRVKAGDVISLSDNIRCEVLQPPDGYQPRGGNGASMVLLVRYGDGAALLTGDLPAAEELAEYPDVDVLKAAHHGSGSSSSERMLRQAKPSLLAVSVGRNGYGHPSARVVASAEALGARVLRTDQCGAVFASVSADGTVSVATFLNPEDASS